MRLLGSERPLAHLVWLGLAAAVCLGMIGWFVGAYAASSRIPGGSSNVGFVAGLLLAAIVVFECALWPRKLARRFRWLGPMHLWMRMHIWLGLLCLPLTFLHSGLSFGHALSNWVTWLMLAVIASGVFGLVMQNTLPKRMLDSVPEEIILSQEPVRLAQNHRLAVEIVSRACPDDDEPAEWRRHAQVAKKRKDHLIVGAVRSPQMLEVDLVQAYSPDAPLTEPAPLLQAFEQIVEPYLDPAKKPSRRGPLASGPKALGFFAELRKRVEPEAEKVVDKLEDFCRQRRQIGRQRRLTFWLHAWIPLHLGLSAFLLVLMFVHAWIAVRYW